MGEKRTATRLVEARCTESRVLGKKRRVRFCPDSYVRKEWNS